MPVSKRTVADYLMQSLRQWGVRRIYGLAGSTTGHLNRALQRRGLRFIRVNREEGAAFAAGVEARITGKLGAVLTCAGPGTVNILTGIIDAKLDRVPMVYVIGQTDTTVPAWGHQAYPFARLFRGVAVPIYRIDRPARIEHACRTGFRRAMAERGPVVIELPADIAGREMAPPRATPRLVHRPPRTIAGSRRSWRRAAALLRGAARPLILLGHRGWEDPADRGRVYRSVAAFARRHRLPILPTILANGALPSRHPNMLPPVVKSRERMNEEVIAGTDAVVAIDYDPTELQPAFWNATGRKRIIHLSAARVKAGYRDYRPELALVGDVPGLLRRLSRELAAWTAPAPALAGVAETRERLARAVAANRADRGTPSNAGRVIAELAAVVKELKRESRTTLTLDSGTNQFQVLKWFIRDGPTRTIASRGNAPMGFAIPGAIGAQLARPRDTVISISGDGGFRMNPQELEIQKELGLPIVNLVLADGQMSHIRERYRREFGPAGDRFAHHLAFTDAISYPDLARGFGLTGRTVTRPAQLRRRLRQALTSRKPCLLVIPVRYPEEYR